MPGKITTVKIERISPLGGFGKTLPEEVGVYINVAIATKLIAAGCKDGDCWKVKVDANPNDASSAKYPLSITWIVNAVACPV